MNELKQIVAAVRQAQREGHEAILATVVGTSGSSYRQAGARMLVTDRGWQAGSISGGCLEGDVIKRGAWLCAGRRAALITYDSTDDDDIVHGLGLGCRGVIQVLIERLHAVPDSPDLIGFFDTVSTARTPAVIATVLGADNDPDAVGRRLLHCAGKVQPYLAHDIADDAQLRALQNAAADALRRGCSVTVELHTATGNVHAFIEYLRPAPPLMIFGAGHDAIPLVTLAKNCGFHVTVVDGRPAYAKPTRFPQADRVALCLPDAVPTQGIDASTVALVMTHNYLSDRAVLRALLRSPAAYIGVLGPKQRTAELLADLCADGIDVDVTQGQRLYAPVGLDIGADTPERVALSIIAEIQAVLSGRQGGHLRDRRGAIHVATQTAVLGAITADAVAACSLSS